MINVAILGFGNVGRELLRFLPLDKVDIKLVASSKGVVAIETKEHLMELVKLAVLEKKLEQHSRFKSNISLKEALDDDIDLAFVSIPPSYTTGEPNLSLYKQLLDKQINIITADKTGLALEYKNTLELAKKRRVFYGFRATVSAGTPAVDFVRGLRGREVKRVDAVLNACTNYILSYIEIGYGWEQAIKKAKEEKLTEPDPKIDIHGLDAAAKVSIIANILGLETSVNDVERVPLDSVSEIEIRRALSMNNRIKYVASIDFESRKLSVKPILLQRSDPLALTERNYNTIKIEVEGEHEIISGPAGPAWRTAKVMVTDFLDFLSFFDF